MIFVLCRFSSEALVTLDVHSKDVLAELHREQVVKNTDFRWLCQLRYYWMVSILNFSDDRYFSICCKLFSIQVSIHSASTTFRERKR